MKLFFFIFLFFFVFPILEKTAAASETQELNLEDLIAELKQEDFFDKKILHVPLEVILKYGIAFSRSIQIAKLDQDVAESQHIGDFSILEPSLTNSYSNERFAPNVSSQASPSFVIPNTKTFSSSFSKNTSIGIRYGFSTNVIDSIVHAYSVETNGQVSSTVERETSIVSNVLSVNIPLRQDLGSVNTASIRRGFLTTKEKQKDLLSETLVFIEGFASVYWELKQIYAMYEVQYEKTLLSEKLYSESKLRQESGAGDSLQVVTSLNNYQSDKIALNNIWNFIIDINEQIKDVFNLLDLELFLYPSDNFPTKSLTENVEYYLDKMIATHPTFLALEVDKEKNKVSLLESKNADKADIDLNLRYSQLGAGFNRQEAIDRLTISELDGYKLELTWKIPFGNKTAKSKKKETLYQKLKIDSQLAGAISNARLGIRKRLRDLKTRQEEIDILQEGLKITEENFSREKIKYENGSSSTILLQELQTELVTSKFNFITAQKNYAVLYNKIFIDTGEIFDLYNIPKILSDK